MCSLLWLGKAAHESHSAQQHFFGLSEVFCMNWLAGEARMQQLMSSQKVFPLNYDQYLEFVNIFPLSQEARQPLFKCYAQRHPLPNHSNGFKNKINSTGTKWEKSPHPINFIVIFYFLLKERIRLFFPPASLLWVYIPCPSPPITSAMLTWRPQKCHRS